MDIQDREREREGEGKRNGRAHTLEGDLEALQEWRLGGGIWRGIENADSYRDSAEVVFFSSSLQILE
jgi:hypothetical protein